MSTVVETLDPDGRRVLDVSALPDSAWDANSPVWWGNLLLIFIESTTMALLFVTYFYLRRNFGSWPPPQSNAFPPVFHPVPDLPIPTIETIMVVLACGLMYVTDQFARKLNRTGTLIGLLIMLAITIAAIVMRFFEFKGVHFRWDDNAYGSIVWWILCVHLTYFLAAAAEFFIMSVWIIRHGIDPKRGMDVTLAGITWYWLAGTLVLVYGVIYFGARIL